jgi:hypothetical protein
MILERVLGLFRRRVVPSSSDVVELLTTAQGLLDELARPTAASRCSPSASQRKAFEDSVQAARKGLPLKDGEIDEAEWNKLTDARKAELYRELEQAVTLGQCLNSAAIKAGWWCFVATGLLLVLLVALYAILQSVAPPWKKTDEVTDARVELSRLESQIRKLAVKQTEATKLATQADAAGAAVAGGAKQAESAREPANRARAEQQALHTAVDSAFETVQNRLLRLSVSSGWSEDILRRLGQVLSEISTEQITTTKTFDEFRAAVERDLSRLAAEETWLGGQRRRIEIAWWAEFGTLVGILFYIAGLQTVGVFKVEEITMFLAEILSAPLVVPVVFFMFQYTSITIADTDKASLTVNLGVAFILGFSIRRTIGLLDLIKKKVLPDPTPTTSPGASAAKGGGPAGPGGASGPTGPGGLPPADQNKIRAALGMAETEPFDSPRMKAAVAVFRAAEKRTDTGAELGDEEIKILLSAKPIREGRNYFEKVTLAADQLRAIQAKIELPDAATTGTLDQATRDAIAKFAQGKAHIQPGDGTLTPDNVKRILE